MAAFINKSGGVRILPDGTEVAPGAEVNLSDDHAKNAGVQAWIKAGDFAPKKGRKEQDKAEN